MSKLMLDRATLAKIAPNPQALRELERVFNGVSGLPSTIEEATAQANQAIALAGQALTMLAELVHSLEAVATAPAPTEYEESDDTTIARIIAHEPDDTAPRVQLGTMSSQSADFVDIDGGAIDGTPIGSSLAAKGTFTDLSASVLTSTVADGTPPLSVASTTLVNNLYVARSKLADTATKADTASSLGTAGTYPADATDLPSAITLVNYIKSRNISKGV